MPDAGRAFRKQSDRHCCHKTRQLSLSRNENSRKEREPQINYPNKIDFQAHYLPKAYYEFLEEEGLYCPDGFPTPEWDESWQQEAMVELGIS